MRCRLSIAPTLILCTFFGACSKDASQLGTVFVKKQLVNADFGAELIVTQAESEPLAGAGVIIPAGALSAHTEITIAFGPDSIVYDNSAVAGPAIELGPDGTTFTRPVEVVLPVKAGTHFDKLRIFVRQASGEQSVILPKSVRYDAATGLAHFYVEHFTTFQCGEAESPCSHLVCPTNDCSAGECHTPCAEVDCGLQPGVPSWTCTDGTPGGFTGECARQADGTCGWVINWCDRGCSVEECGPAPGAPNLICPDGTTAGPICERGENDVCGWHFTTCPTPCDNTTCDAGEVCDPTTGTCRPNSTPCGENTCGADAYCCNESCGICAPHGAGCTAQECPAGCGPNNPCPTGFECKNDGSCLEIRTPCGQNECGAGESCCNESCGLCAGPAGTCPAIACVECGGVLCAPGEICHEERGAVHCGPAECGLNDCGPPLGLPNWTCEGGETGGPTGVCQRNADGTCGWEVNWCTRACEDAECGPPPGAPNEQCNDGTIAGPICRREATTGSCTWVIEHCGP